MTRFLLALAGVAVVILALIIFCRRLTWWLARLGAWLIRIAVTRSPGGGAAVVSMVVGEDPYGGCWHRGTAGQARAVTLLAREEAKILDGQAILLDEIGDLTKPND